MPFFNELAPSRCLTVETWPDIDSFSGVEALAKSRSIPLRWTATAPAVAVLPLPRCTIYLERTFPRILQAEYQTKGRIVAFCFDGRGAARINGVEMREPSVALIRGGEPCEIVDDGSSLFCLIDFQPGAVDWSEAGDRSCVIRSNDEDLERLRIYVGTILTDASRRPDLFVGPETVRSLEDGLIDAVTRLARGKVIPVRGQRQQLLVRRLDALLELNVSEPPTSSEIVRSLDVPLRTLSAAVRKYRGLGLQQYSRVRRLWQVRRLICRSAVPAIGTLAQAHGFRHMGEFSRAYRSFFGETPSQTLARAKKEL